MNNSELKLIIGIVFIVGLTLSTIVFLLTRASIIETQIEAPTTQRVEHHFP